MSNSYKTNAIRGPINSLTFRVLDSYLHKLFGSAKHKLFKDHPQTIVEIGSGTGANMRYLKKGTKVISIEPNTHMHANLRRTAHKYGIDLEIKTLIGEAIDLPDNSCNYVVSTLVLCTVENPALCVDQIKRILKPSGEFVFVEHVKAQGNSMLSKFQNWVHKPWHWFFEGCHTNRDTKALLESAGFSKLEVEEYKLYSPFVPIIPQIRGRAFK